MVGLTISHILDWRLHTNFKRRNGTEATQEQEHYLVQFEPMLVERWALPKFRAEGYCVTTVQPIAHDDAINNPDASCEICCNPNHNEDPQLLPDGGHALLDMIVCSTCCRTYHWSCLCSGLHCYTEQQRSDINADDNWACPACKDLNTQGKEARIIQARSNHTTKSELVRVEWKPSWEAMDRTDASEHTTHFLKCITEFKNARDTADKSLSTADRELHELERQGLLPS